MRFFFYGTLLDRDVIALVLGRREMNHRLASLGHGGREFRFEQRSAVHGDAEAGEALHAG